MEVNTTSSAPMEVQVPQYTIAHSSVVCANFDVRTGAGVAVNSPYTQNQFLLCTASDVTSWSTLRSVGDDFQLGYFCGIPPMVLSP